MLRFAGAWRYASPGGIPDEVRAEFARIIGRIAAQRDRKDTLEHFKDYFAKAAGTTSYGSSDSSWAETDLTAYMEEAAKNAPLFIEAFYDGCSDLAEADRNIEVPELTIINDVLTAYGAGYQIQPPNLIATAEGALSVPVYASSSLDEKAINLIQESLSKADRFLAQNEARPAVQEILWLLETVTTAFRGVTVGEVSIQGKYFNKILKELKKAQEGKALDQISEWIENLHGYLSSPTGGGVRHGIDLKDGIATELHEARLFCNLIRSYVSYLLSEYDRLHEHHE